MNDLTAIRAQMERLRVENERLTREASYHQQELNSLLKRSRIWQDRAEKAEAAARTENEAQRKALQQGVDLIRGDAVGREWKRGCASFIKEARAALGQEGDA